MTSFFKSWEDKRVAYKKLPRVLRVPLAGLAFVLAPLGVIAMFTPLAVLEVGSILVFVSLTILSFEFDWAHNLLVFIREKLANKKLRTRLTVFTVLMLTTYAIVIVFWLLKK